MERKEPLPSPISDEHRMASKRHHLELIDPHGGRLYRFRDLPEAAQLSLVQYMAVDGEAWADLQPEFADPYTPEAHADVLRRVLPEAIRLYGDREYGLVTIPMSVITADVLKSPDIPYSDWETYHAWYVGMGHMPSYAQTRWPPILSSFPDETLEDGWHRLHDYYRKGDTAVTCLYYPRGPGRV